jgi:hypothetical protein
LVALIARVVGYDGPILGWERAGDGHEDGGGRGFVPLEPAWWSTCDASKAEASQHYVARS